MVVTDVVVLLLELVVVAAEVVIFSVPVVKGNSVVTLCGSEVVKLTVEGALVVVVVTTVVEATSFCLLSALSLSSTNVCLFRILLFTGAVSRALICHVIVGSPETITIIFYYSL